MLHSALADRLHQKFCEGGWLVHSGFRSVSGLVESPEALVRLLVDIQGESGVLFPTFTGRAEDGPDDPPVFDVRTTVGYTGAVPEAARRLAGPLRRSLSASHSFVAFGSQAEAWLPDQVRSRRPCDAHSPLRKLAAAGGRILLLGCGLDALTLVHAAEEEAEVPYVLQLKPTRVWVTDAAGERRDLGEQRLHSWETPRDFPSLSPLLREAGVLEETVIEGATLLSLEADRTLEVLTEAFRRDPWLPVPRDRRRR